MPTPAQIVVSGTPNTSQLGVGAIAGNTVTIGGLTLAPNQPGWSLVSSQGGPGYVSGVWQLGSDAAPGVMPAQGAFYRSGSGGSGGGISGEDNTANGVLSTSRPFQLSKTGGLLLGLIATLMLTDKDR